MILIQRGSKLNFRFKFLSVNFQLAPIVKLLALFLLSSCGLNTGIHAQSTNSISQDMSDGLREKLDTLYQEDQKIRFEIIELQRSLSAESDSIQKLAINKQLKEKINVMLKQDALNLSFVTDLLEKQGWPNKNDVSLNGGQAVFLVLQHADLATQKKFLPVVEEAVKVGNTLPSNLAILKDRIGIREKGEQIYGSQIWTDPATQNKYVDVLIDPENVDKRRAEVGLPSMGIYLKFLQMDWDPVDYKNNILPKLKDLKKAAQKK